jgi:hypothetical protein
MDWKKLLTLFVLIILLVWVIKLNWPSRETFELDIDENFFALKESNLVSMVVIEDGNEKKVLKKWGSFWIINDKYKAEPTYVKRMIDLSTQVKLKRIWDEEVDTHMVNFIKISYYNDTILLMEYFLKKNGLSVIKKEKKSKAYLAEIPGFSDSFGDYFAVHPSTWKTDLIFFSTLRTLNELIIHHSKINESSIHARYKDGFFEIDGLIQPDTQKVGKYLYQFSEVRYDYSLNDSLQKIAYKLLENKKPFLTIEVKDIDSTRNNKLMVYEIPENKKYYLGTTKIFSDTFLVNKKLIHKLTPTLKQLSK